MLQNVSSEERGEQTKHIGEWFQESVCKTNIKSPTSSAKIAKQSAQKLESWCTTLKPWQVLHLNVNLFWALDSLQRLDARCPVLVWYTITDMARCFGTKNNRHHLVGLLTSSATLGIERSFAFYARMLNRKKIAFSILSILESVFLGA